MAPWAGSWDGRASAAPGQVVLGIAELQVHLDSLSKVKRGRGHLSSLQWLVPGAYAEEVEAGGSQGRHLISTWPEPCTYSEAHTHAYLPTHTCTQHSLPNVEMVSVFDWVGLQFFPFCCCRNDPCSIEVRLPRPAWLRY